MSQQHCPLAIHIYPPFPPVISLHVKLWKPGLSWYRTLPIGAINCIEGCLYVFRLQCAVARLSLPNPEGGGGRGEKMFLKSFPQDKWDAWPETFSPWNKGGEGLGNSRIYVCIHPTHSGIPELMESWRNVTYSTGTTGLTYEKHRIQWLTAEEISLNSSHQQDARIYFVYLPNTGYSRTCQSRI